MKNDGIINSGEDALDIRGADNITILNLGTLRGDSDGIVTSSVAALTKIVNRGTIDGGDSGGIDHLDGDLLVINRGTIRSEGTYGFDGAQDRDELTNFGSIVSGVLMRAGDDFVFNSGTIDFVDLGEGDDFYFGRGKGSAESVDGGDGRDILLSSRSDDRFTGGLLGDIFGFRPAAVTTRSRIFAAPTSWT